jgi:cytochrome c5
LSAEAGRRAGDSLRGGSIYRIELNSTGEGILKTKLPIGTSCAFFALAVTFVQTPTGDQGLTDNPVFKKDCAGCHGKTAEGRHFGGPSLISDKVAAASAEDLHNMITNGKGRMPKYAGKLKPEEIDKLVQEIRALNKK